MPLNPTIRSELTTLIPHGLLATRRWLGEKGLTRHSLDNLVKSGQLVPLAPGIYKRPETALKWRGVVVSLQRMGTALVVGGITALQLQGFSHYLSHSGPRTINLYGYDRVPVWANRLGLEEIFQWHGNARLWGPDERNEMRVAFTVGLPWGDQGAELRVSSPERAILELLADVPKAVSFEHAEQLMQGLTTLSPRRLETLLLRSRNVKAKRLFFWLAERQGHAWLGNLNPDRFDLGRGKRMVARGGRLDPKYLITVPRVMNG